LGGGAGVAAASIATVSADWQRVTDLFGAARLLDAAGRRAFLDLACAGDDDLRAEVDVLLSADAANDSFLERPPAAAIVDALSPLANPILTGRILRDRYVVEERVASGGQAIVYRATDRVLSRTVVIKVMRSTRLHNAVLKVRFEHEMQALSRIDHPAVVGILDVGELDDGSPFLVIQYIDGASLREVLQHGALDAPRAVRVLRAVAAALSTAHAAGIAHQDLKPENIMVQRLGDGAEAVKLIDFGIAKIERLELQPEVTTVMIAGSVRYMAPEQFEGRNSPASDTYALGLLACELLCGQPNVRALPRTVGRRVTRLIESATAFRQEDRPRDLTAWSEALGAALAGRDGTRRLLLRAVMAACVVIVAGLVEFALVPRHIGEGERIIEKVGGFDPLVEGFQTHNDPTGTVVRNADNSEFIGWSVTSAHPGGAYYYRPLTDAQMKRALTRGWTLSAVMQPNESGAYAVVDFDGYSNRFDINVLLEPDDDLVRLNTQLVPVVQGQELRIPRTQPTYHKYELRFDPGLRTASLWVDGERRLTGYRGHSQFQAPYGLMFGTAPYKSERGMASFQSVRFEINP
jgi:tRNA A-37 threonylcarbamoyl transferase component Bud32